MDSAMVVELAREALWMTMLISAPLLVVGLAIGLLVGIFQAATSINEQTLSFIPKVVCDGDHHVNRWQLDDQHHGGIHQGYLRSYS